MPDDESCSVKIVGSKPNKISPAHLYRFVIPAVTGTARLVPLASLADEKSGLTANALRVAAIRVRLRAQKSGQGTWLSSKKWVQEYQTNKCSRG